METDKRPRAFVINESYVSLIVWNVSLPKVRLALVLLLLLLTLDLDLNRIVRLRDPVWSFWEEERTSSLFATDSERRNRSRVWKTCEENLKLPNEVKEIRSKNHIVIISTVSRSFTEVEVTRCGYLPSCEAVRWISYTFTDVEVGYFFLVYTI